jgi:ABC-type transport system involved in cytochrome c biogenesis permease component
MLAWLLPIIGLPVAITGLVFGVRSLNSVNKGMAIAGLTLSIIGTVLSIINASIGAYMGATGQL